MNYFRNSHILIVDDVALHIQSAVAILKKQPFTIQVAKNPETAWLLIEKKTPDLILLDIHLEGADGFDLARCIKEHPAYQEIAIIFLTSSNDSASIEKGFELGGQDYITKPYHPSELLARVNAHLRIINQYRELQIAYQELDCFTHTVSHDLKSPLQVITQLVNLLETQGNYTPTQETIMEKIRCKCLSTEEMIQKLLSFSQIVQQEMELQTVELTPLFQKISKDFTLLYPDETIELDIAELPTVYADYELCHNIIQNVLSNAFKFSAGKEMIKIQVSAASDINGHKIIVTDNGSGFDPQQKAKLFHIFERLHSNDYEGSGVGLVTVKRLMEKFGGSVTIDSQLNQGTTLTLEFPQHFDRL